MKNSLLARGAKIVYEFITNNFELPAEKIAEIYKNRWQIETMFKRLKQNFPLKYFLGDTQNAIEIQSAAIMPDGMSIPFVIIVICAKCRLFDVIYWLIAIWLKYRRMDKPYCAITTTCCST
ncbi:MAG: transposase [Ignavibacteriaceae bacterium]|nr:transposase [Ignavibacteriaceae bacterium]